jgi:hypothetical protein
MAEVDGTHFLGRGSSPEESLIHAVILRAVVDLFTLTVPGASEEARPRLRDEALHFLTARKGPWAARREELCVAVGLDPDHVRETVIDVLEGRRDLPQSGLNGRAFSGLGIARKLWKRHDPTDVARIEREAVARADQAAAARAARAAEKREAAARAERNKLLSMAEVVEDISDFISLPD